jgi:hypothetical protein
MIIVVVTLGELGVDLQTQFGTGFVVWPIFMLFYYCVMEVMPMIVI